jgi:hypothetical protein
MGDAIFRVGFTGHQQLGDEATVSFVSQRLCELLTTYQQQASKPGQRMLASSCLALGSDRLFVKTALELNIPVEAVLPCARYEEIFTSAEARAEYHQLLERSQYVHRLSLQECSDDAYLAAGQWIVDQSDVMILVWNGYPAAGRSGTGDIANYARLVRRPFVHVHTRLHTTKMYGSLLAPPEVAPHMTPRREFSVAKQTVYQGNVLAVNQYRLRMPNGEEIERDIVERPESVLVLPVGLYAGSESGFLARKNIPL